MTVPVSYMFDSVTNGHDEELDMLNVTFEAVARLKHDAALRVLDYVTNRIEAERVGVA